MDVDPSFSILGASVVAQGKSEGPLEESSTEVERNQALDACLAASELFEFGITLNNSVYRCRSLCWLKLLHAMRCEDLGCVSQSREYIMELKEFAKSHSVKNPGLLNQLEQLEHRFQDAEGDKELAWRRGLTEQRERKGGRHSHPAFQCAGQRHQHAYDRCGFARNVSGGGRFSLCASSAVPQCPASLVACAFAPPPCVPRDSLDASPVCGVGSAGDASDAGAVAAGHSPLAPQRSPGVVCAACAVCSGDPAGKRGIAGAAGQRVSVACVRAAQTCSCAIRAANSHCIRAVSSCSDSVRAVQTCSCSNSIRTAQACAIRAT